MGCRARRAEHRPGVRGRARRPRADRGRQRSPRGRRRRAGRRLLGATSDDREPAGRGELRGHSDLLEAPARARAVGPRRRRRGHPRCADGRDGLEPAGQPLRTAGDPPGRRGERATSLAAAHAARRRPLRGAERGRLRRRRDDSRRHGAQPRRDPPARRRDLRRRCDPRRARRRPLDRRPEHDGGRGPLRPGYRRRDPLRRARRHRQPSRGCRALARHADAAGRRPRLDPGRPVPAGRPPRVLARATRVPVDARRRVPLVDRLRARRARVRRVPRRR